MKFPFEEPTDRKIAWLPEMVYTGAGQFERGLAIICDSHGQIISLSRDIPAATEIIPLPGRACLPGLANAHSHAFQRTIRAHTERRSEGDRSAADSFWTWRDVMYQAAARLTPEDIYDASRMAFLEMALGGITAVGEFHYLHHTPEGKLYDDPNLLAKQVIRAARDVGLRIVLLHVAYARSGYQTPVNARQIRFLEPDSDTYLRHLELLRTDIAARDEKDRVSVGAAPHSVRAVPLAFLREVTNFAARHQMPVHMHVAEQPAEVEACLREYNTTPLALLAGEGLLHRRFTAIHAIHITLEEIRLLAETGARVCVCPTTERNLGDGIAPADALFNENVPIALGTDSHVEIDLLEDARELEYHLRLKRLERAVLAPRKSDHSSLAARLFECASKSGAESIGTPGGELKLGSPADFFTVDLNDPSIAGAGDDDLLSAILFCLERTAIRDVIIDGQTIVRDGRHADQEEIVERFSALQRRLWGK